MASNLVVVPAEQGEGFVQLARSPQGRLYRKQILHVNGSFVHPKIPGKKITVTREMADTMVRNFHNGACDIVQVPLVDSQNKHVEDPLRNIGEVVDLEATDTGVYAVIDARKKEYADELGKTLLGASAMMHLDYTDTKTGNHVGPTLLHVAVTNRPYITNLSDFEEVIAASADNYGEDRPVVLSPATDTEEDSMDLDEMLASLKEEHGIDVLALQEKAKAPGQVDTAELVTALSAVLQDAGAMSLSNTDEDTVTIEDVANAVIELSQDKVALAETVAELKADNDEMKLSRVKAEVKGYVAEGRILPSQTEAMEELALTNREMFDKLLPGDAIIELSERGVTTHDEPQSQKLNEDIERLAALANGTN